MLKIYMPIRQKYIWSLIFAVHWVLLSSTLALPYINKFGDIIGYFFAWLIVISMGVVPSFMTAFIFASILADRRPFRKLISETKDSKGDFHTEHPPLTIVIAAYNEEEDIARTLHSVLEQTYVGELTIFVMNDGSTDRTKGIVTEIAASHENIVLVNILPNGGKANALNIALEKVKTELVVTLDGDSCLYKDALKHIVERYLSDPPDTIAVAGVVIIRNPHESLITKMQEWDYFNYICAVKRMQSMYHGVMVAQGAFSIYKTSAVREVGGWPHTVGEDIVLSWALLNHGYRIGYAEDAYLFTTAPKEFKQFIKQRNRWSRGLVEAFKAHWGLLFKSRLSTLFIWWNLTNLYLDMAYSIFYIPVIIATLFGHPLLAIILTIFILPIGVLVNIIMFFTNKKCSKGVGLEIKSNYMGFVLYTMFYNVILQPSCVYGYIKELTNGAKKTWGTK